MNSETMKIMWASLAVTWSDDSVQVPAARVSDRRGFGPLPAHAVPDETLIIDERSGLRPAQMVENKLTWMLREASLPASYVRMRGLLRSR
jgi:hypothetical protein